ncbi:uncharacterized protein BDZ99DRAFT_539835 [Mytilinidion resinicola]|uniref:P-loop containing nucleoside triphosphate hydrolase protein n=1 Tax=Mytilinidion resinicola TaxID=574789 RepID=A0A6A6YA08_9PEZI|nr:uncharacterized protein BDZ99DRAFT_539835 [Mytilinidion resinicola]KAF2805459.1 hypothetical protein BDZ99DRAFT_539835 [Mytilinidion resinicola]
MKTVSLTAAPTDVSPSSGKKSFRPLFLNTNTPWSAFICGSQGSGKSHTLGCMLEGCLSNNSKIGKLPHPLAGMVFHYNKSAGAPCEAAGVHSGEIQTTVLCSPTNLAAMRGLYQAQPGASAHLTVEPLYLESSHLNIERMWRLMAFSDAEKDPPLYMQTVRKILRSMAERINAGRGEFDYNEFSRLIDEEDFDNKQKAPLRLRLDILESFMAPKPKTKKTGGPKKGQSVPQPQKAPTVVTKNILAGKPGALIVIDLTDPFLDTDTACLLFEICLSEFLDKTDCGKVVALDEAHNYMSANAPGADIFTEKLLNTAREQRHKGARIIVATQEPTISPKLLDLCSMTFVHRFTSPAWFTTIKAHIGGASIAAIGSEGQSKMFEEIMGLKLGESLLFSPTAAIGVEGDEIETMKVGRVKFKTRPRISHDAGASVLASNAP